jgi:N-acetylglucosamine kinase-like BadF-type ATPase
MTGGSNIIRLGETPAREALQTAVHHACSAARISTDQIHAICIGVAGASMPEIAAKIRGILTELTPQISLTNLEVVGDNVIALEAAFGTGPGVIAIAGTGSIVYGRDAAGHITRAGGWGFAISDEGSGHWIGRRAISAILHCRDQGLETTLAAMVLQAWKLTSIDDLVKQANSTPPPDFPRLFPIVLRAAEEGDSIARELLADAGAKLGDLATAVVRRLAPHDMLPVAMTGSVFRQSSEVRQVFYNTLRASFPGIDVRQEPADPVAGALARARRM